MQCAVCNLGLDLSTVKNLRQGEWPRDCPIRLNYLLELEMHHELRCDNDFLLSVCILALACVSCADPKYPTRRVTMSICHSATFLKLCYESRFVARCVL